MKVFSYQNKQYPSFKMNYEIVKTPNVSDDFVESVKQNIEDIPDVWGEQLEKNGYKLYCANSIKDVFEREGLPKEDAPDWEAVTCSHPAFKFFVFTPKIKMKDLKKVLNHEISHGIVDTEEIMDNESIQFALFKDSRSHSENLRDDESLWNPENLISKNLDYYKKNEICADILAWSHLKQGLWGSGYKGGLKDSNFLRKNFPNVFEKINEFKVGETKAFVNNAINNSYNEEDLPF